MARELGYAEVVELARTITVARMLERDDFAAARCAAADLGLRAALPAACRPTTRWPCEADVELGGTDQLYNLLAGREVMTHVRPRAAGRADNPAPALLGRREDELVGRQQHPARPRVAQEMFGLHDAHPRRARQAVVAARRERDPRLAPLESKLALARFIVARSHGDEAAGAQRRKASPRVVRRGEIPEQIDEVALPAETRSTFRRCSSPASGCARPPRRAASSIRAASSSAARRRGARRRTRASSSAQVLQVGKRRFGRLVEPAA